MKLSGNARWLTLGVIAVLGVSTSVAAVRNSDDDPAVPAERPSAAVPAGRATVRPEPRAEAAKAPDAPAEPGLAGEEMASAAAPPSAPRISAETQTRIGDRTTRRVGAALPVRIGDRTTLMPAPEPAVPPDSSGSASIGSPMSPMPPPSGAPEPAAQDPGPPSGSDQPTPGATPSPPPATLIDATAAVKLEPVRFLIRAGANPYPEADVTVGEERVIGDAPPPERTEVGVGGELAPQAASTILPGWGTVSA